MSTDTAFDSDSHALHRRQKAVERMNRIDALPADIRELIHEEGYTVVDAFLSLGVKKASQIRHLILAVRRGSTDPAPRAKGGNDQQTRSMVIIPSEPTPAMINASMETVSGHDIECSKYEKHQRRLRAAIKAGIARVA